MHTIWTEELTPLVVADDTSSARLTARITVTGIGSAPAHVDVVLVGELCAGTTPVLADLLRRTLAHAPVDVRFDLAALRLCTSAAIDLWVDLAGDLLPHGCDLHLDGAGGVVRRALDAVGVSDAGTVHPHRR